MPPLTRCRIFALGAAVVTVALGAGLSGCASGPSYTVKIDAMSNPRANSGYSFTLATNDPARASRDPHYAEVVQRVHTALEQRGMFEAPNPAQADVVIDFDYGEHPPLTHVTTVSQPVVLQQDPTMMGGGISSNRGGVYPGSGIGATGTGQQIVMVETERITQTTEKYIRISARENVDPRARGAAPPQQVWAVEATLEDESTTLDKSIPAMIDAAIEYIGTNTGGRRNVVVNLDS